MVEVTTKDGVKIWFKDLEEYNKYVEALQKYQDEFERRMFYGKDFEKPKEEKDEKN